jgi:hypothetical protein
MRNLALMILLIIVFMLSLAGCEKDATGLEPGQGRLDVYSYCGFVKVDQWK